MYVPSLIGTDAQRLVGDINSDAAINIADLIIKLQIVSGNSPENIDLCGDANGKIGIEDALNSLQVTSGLKLKQ
jgi:hypothetical protein